MIRAATEFDFLSQDLEKVKFCPICGCSDSRPLSRVDRVGIPMTFRFCTTCAVVFGSPRMTQQGYTEFYQSGLYRKIVELASGPSDQESLKDSQRAIARNLIETFGEQLSVFAGTAGVDIGGSMGITARALKKFYKIDMEVVEPCESEAEECKREGIETHIKTVEEWEPSKSYDVITMIATIDHVLDPVPILKKLRQVSQGLLIIDCVHFPARYAQLQNGACKIDHPVNYYPNVFEALLKRCGFRPIKTAPRGTNIYFACVPDDEVPDAMPGPATVHHVIYEAYLGRATNRGRLGWKHRLDVSGACHADYSAL